MSSSVRKINFPVAVGSFTGIDENIINGVTIVRDDHDHQAQVTQNSCGLYSQKKNTSQFNSLKLNMSYATGGPVEERPSLPASSRGSNGPGSLLTIGISNSLSVISPLSKDSNSAQASGLRHRANLGTQIDKHLLKAEELRKFSKGFNIKVSKRWFVLYDDTHKPIGAGESPQIQNNYPPAATHHDVILDSTGSPVSAVVDEPYYIPAHLEYHDNERKWKAGGVPNKDIILKDCFNICRKLDGAGIKDPVIAVTSLKDTLDIIFEKEQDMLIWLELLLSCQQGGRSAQGRIAKPIYENMWEVNVKGFKSEKGSNKGFFQMTGPHRLVATDENFKFFEVGSDEPISFAYKDIKGHKKQGRTYVIHTGRTTRSGRGEIDVDCKDHHVADQIYAIFDKLTKEAVPNGPSNKAGRHGFHNKLRQNSTSSQRSSRSRDSVQGHANVSQQGTPGMIATRSDPYRPRSESWSNPTLSHSFSGTRHGVLPGHPDSTEVPIQGNINNEDKLSIPLNSQGIAIGKQSIIGNLRTKKDLRYRTTSEGNHFGNIASFKTRGKSITSGSPMSPGSYISSESAVESAGSSNSIDDTEIGYGSSMTPNNDHPQAPTIFEESSAESWVDIHDPKSIEEQIMKEENSKLDNSPTDGVNDSTQNSMRRQLAVSSLINPPFSVIPKESSVELAQFPSSCDSPDMKMSSMIRSHSSTTQKIAGTPDEVDSGAVTYAELSLERNNTFSEEQYKGNGQDFLPGTHQGLVGVPIPRYPGSFRRGNVGGESMGGIMDTASSPSQTQYATIMSSNDVVPMNIPCVPLSLVTTAAKPTLSRDLTIATSPIAGGTSDYMLMSPPPPMATPPVPNTIIPSSLNVANNSNNINNNVSSTAINLSSIPTGSTNNYSGSSSSTSSLKRQTSIGNGSNCGARSNISTLERNRRRISMLGLDEGQITSSLMTSSLTGSVSNPRDPSSSLITSPSSQSSYNPLSDGGGIDREDITGGDEDASVYTLMSPTGATASETSCVPIPGANIQNATKTTHQISQSFQYSRASNNSSLNRRSGRRSVGSNHKDVFVGDFTSTKHMQSQNIPGEEEQDPYVHMSPSGASNGTTSYKNSISNNYNGGKHGISGNIVTDNKCDINTPLEHYDMYERSSNNAQSQNAEESSFQSGSRRGSKSSLSHLGSSPSAALTSHLSGPLLPLYTDVSHSSTATSNLDQQDDSSPYLLMSPVNSEDKPIAKEESESLVNHAALSSSMRTHSSSSNPLYSGMRRHRNRVSNSGSKRSSMCSDTDPGTVLFSNSSIKGTSGSSSNVEATEWSGGTIGRNDAKQGSRNSSLSGTPIGSLPSYNPSTSLHDYKKPASGSQQGCSEKVNLMSEYNDDVYVPLSFGDDDPSNGRTMPLQDHEIALSQSRQSTSSTSGNIQIPSRHGQQRSIAQRMSPASSGSLISGTPNSLKGVDSFSAHTSELSKSNNEDRDATTVGRKSDLSHHEEHKPSFIHNRAFSLSSSNRPPTVSSSTSSIGSALGPACRQNTTGDNVTGKPSATINSGTSPNTMAARLGSWFRTRAGSVPSRPSINGRRNRTQSEGEKNGIEASKLPENHQLE